MPSYATKDQALDAAQAILADLAAKGIKARIVVDDAPAGEPAGASGVNGPTAPQAEQLPVTPLTSALIDRARAAGFSGTGVLLGGDLEDMNATLIVYKDTATGSDRPVLWAKVLAESDAKIMAAIARAQGMVYQTVVKTEQRSGRAPWDTQHSVAERIVQYAKSVNYHVGDGTPIPDHTLDGIQDLRAVLDAIDASALTPSEKAALEGYRQDLAQIALAAQKREKTPRKDYGPRTCDYVETREEVVPVPASAGTLKVEQRPGSRLDVRTGKDRPIWRGDRLTETGTTEFAIEFGDGWSAVYHPSDPKYKVPFSRRGTLELHMPPDADPASIPDHLARLNLHGAPATPSEAEIVYLSRCAWALGVTGEAWTAAKGQGDALLYRRAGEIVWDRAAASGTDDVIGQAIQQAARETAPMRAALLRRAVEKHLGMAEGSLLKDPRYRPLPVWDPARGEGGAYRWERFDVDPDAVRKAAGARHLVIGHTIHAAGSTRVNQIKKILETGMLAAQETRLTMGVTAAGALSPAQDQHTGGAAYVFCAVRPEGSSTIEWDADVLLCRSDWFYRPGDFYGATNTDDTRGRAPRITDPLKVLQHPPSTNEIVFKGGIGIYGPYAPKRIRAGDLLARQELLDWCKARGITHIGGRPVDEVIVA